MKTVNPLHLIALLVMVLLFLFMQLSKVKDDLTQTKDTYTETLALTTSLKGLNDIYSDKNGVRKSIGIILKQHSLKSANIKQTIGKTSITLSSQSMDKIALNSFMSKILNGSYNVDKFTIKRLSDTKASFIMELKW
ncbi:hypothetical protein N9X61_00655 [Sulfurimonas sp.]|nr:hypothetical protein [Sulfurimonas sp.]